MKTYLDIKSQDTEGKIINTRINYINPEVSFKVLSEFSRALINLTSNTYIDAFLSITKTLESADFSDLDVTSSDIAEIIAGTYSATDFEISAADIESILNGTYTPTDSDITAEDIRIQCGMLNV